MSKATQAELEELHGLVVKDLIKKAKGEEGNLTAQELSVAAKILKDNEITCDPEEVQGDPSGFLKDELPFEVEFGK